MQGVQLTRIHRILIAVVVAGAIVIAAIGFAGSYAAVRVLAERKGFGAFSPFFPIGVDAGIVVLLALDLLLTWIRIPFPLLRQTAWLLTAATIAFNGAAAWPDPLGVGMHAVIPVLFVVTVEAARHATGRVAAITADKHMEGVRLSRWLLAFPSTFRLWRRMKLWELRSYEEVIRMEQDRLIYETRLRARYGRSWRRRAPVEALMPLKLARYGVPLRETAPQATKLTEPPELTKPAPGQQAGQQPAEAEGTLAAGPQHALATAAVPEEPEQALAHEFAHQAAPGPQALAGHETVPGHEVAPEAGDDAAVPVAVAEHGPQEASPQLPEADAGAQPEGPAPRRVLAAPARPEELFIEPRPPEPVPVHEDEYAPEGDGGYGRYDEYGQYDGHAEHAGYRGREDAEEHSGQEDHEDYETDASGTTAATGTTATAGPGATGSADGPHEYEGDPWDGGQPVGIPDGVPREEVYFEAYRQYVATHGEFPNAAELALALRETMGVSTADGNPLNVAYLDTYMREFKDRYNIEMGLTG